MKATLSIHLKHSIKYEYGNTDMSVYNITIIDKDIHYVDSSQSIQVSIDSNVKNTESYMYVSRHIDEITDASLIISLSTIKNNHFFSNEIKLTLESFDFIKNYSIYIDIPYYNSSLILPSLHTKYYNNILHMYSIHSLWNTTVYFPRLSGISKIDTTDLLLDKNVLLDNIYTFQINIDSHYIKTMLFNICKIQSKQTLLISKCLDIYINTPGSLIIDTLVKPSLIIMIITILYVFSFCMRIHHLYSNISMENISIYSSFLSLLLHICIYISTPSSTPPLYIYMILCEIFINFFYCMETIQFKIPLHVPFLKTGKSRYMSRAVESRFTSIYIFTIPLLILLYIHMSSLWKDGSIHYIYQLLHINFDSLRPEFDIYSSWNVSWLYSLILTLYIYAPQLSINKNIISISHLPTKAFHAKYILSCVYIYYSIITNHCTLWIFYFESNNILYIYIYI
ncbi:hypothetical protein WA158_004259 [Blastocystis sp. Blastoise]